MLNNYAFKKFLIIVQGLALWVLLMNPLWAQEYIYKGQIGSKGSANGQFETPTGITFDNAGNMYVADRYNHRIQKFDANGQFLSQFGSYGTENGQFKLPMDIALDAQGNMYVSDYDNNRIQKFDPSGQFLSKFGGYGQADGLFSRPFGITIDKDGNIYVADHFNHRIQKFNANGQFLFKFGSYGSGDGQFYNPSSVAIDNAGSIYVSDQNNHRLQKFDANGTFLLKFGMGYFNEARSITMDREGNFLVADFWNARILKFDPNGQFLSQFGSYGSGEGQLSGPNFIAIDEQGNLYITEQYNHRVQIFAPSLSITTDAISPTALCVGSTVSVPFTTTSTFANDNIFNAQLSDKLGSFANPTSIGTLAGTSSGIINANIPADIPAGSGYRIRVIASNPAITGFDNGTDLTISALPVATVTTSGLTKLCAGGSVILTASAGSSYLWSTGETSQAITVNAAGEYSVTVTNESGCSATSAAVSISTNVQPVVNTISATTTLLQISTATSTSATFTDEDIDDSHTATWDWNDGTTSAGEISNFTVTGSHTYTVPGVYTVKLTVTDACGAKGHSSFQYVVVYDPDGGFVTGGGWINSPAGAYTVDPSLSGKANFGFVSKYKPGTNIPTGNTEFQFKAGNLNFKSSSYEWLVVAGASAKFKGDGTINGGGNYGFMLSAVDGALKGDGVLDKFRIKIWEKVTDKVVYDNEINSSDDAEATTAIAGGSIVIHKAESGSTARYDDATAKGQAIGEEGLETPAAFKLNVYPNPVQKELAVELESETEEEVTISIYDLLGRKVYEQKQKVIIGTNQIILDVDSWKVDTNQLLFRLQTPSKGLHQLMLLKPE